MDFKEVLRHFGDLTKVDPAIGLANEITNLIKSENSTTSSHIQMLGIYKLMKYIISSKNPRLYQDLIKTIFIKLNGVDLKEVPIKQLIFLLIDIGHL